MSRFDKQECTSL